MGSRAKGQKEFLRRLWSKKKWFYSGKGHRSSGQEELLPCDWEEQRIICFGVGEVKKREASEGFSHTKEGYRET